MKDDLERELDGIDDKSSDCHHCDAASQGDRKTTPPVASPEDSPPAKKGDKGDDAFEGKEIQSCDVFR